MTLGGWRLPVEQRRLLCVEIVGSAASCCVHALAPLGLGSEVAVDDVAQPAGDDLARIVVGERVVEPRIPLPVRISRR